MSRDGKIPASEMESPVFGVVISDFTGMAWIIFIALLGTFSPGETG